VVASFRTDSRAATVAAEVTALGLTHRTRTVSDGWRQVLVGPYSTRAEAEAVQQRLDDAGLSASQIVAR
jgi:cell division protein FtsN